jgi:hypothetical protein
MSDSNRTFSSSRFPPAKLLLRKPFFSVRVALVVISEISAFKCQASYVPRRFGEAFGYSVTIATR